MAISKKDFIEKTKKEWETNPRWKGIKRTYTPEDVWSLKGTVEIKHSLAELGAKKMWKLLNKDGYTRVLSAVTGKSSNTTS